MEQMITDFIIKASELVLRNRLPSTSNTERALFNQPAHASQNKFQLSFDRQSTTLGNNIPLEWSRNPNKLLIMEFFLTSKSTNTKFLLEQWVFDISHSSNNKLSDTIDSQQTLYHKLSVLLRTISLLTVTLPLCYNNRKKINNHLFTLEHSINFLDASWHPSTYDDRDLDDYKGPDFVLPGRIFTFKVKYSKSQNLLQEEPAYGKLPQTVAISPIEDDYESIFATEDVSAAILEASRPRVRTMDSGCFGDDDVLICENEEENFTEVLSWKEISMRNKSPERISLYNAGREEHYEFQNYRKISEEFEKGGLRLSSITKPIEKIIEQNDDDKIAELLHSIDELKLLTRGPQSGRSSLSSRTTARTEREDSSQNKSGLKFESNLYSRKESTEEVLNPLVELNVLKDLYLEIKRTGLRK